MIKMLGGVKKNKGKVRKEAATYEEIMYAAALPYVQLQPENAVNCKTIQNTSNCFVWIF